MVRDQLGKGTIARRKARWGLLFILPNFIGFLAFTLIPVIASLVISLTNWDIVSAMKFVGISNYINLFKDRIFIKSLQNTLYYTVLTVPIGMALALLLAVLLNSKTKIFHVYRTFIFLPVVTSSVAISLVWALLFNTEAGLFNVALKAIGMKPVKWLTDTNIAMLSVAIMAVWKGLGYNMTIYLSGLQGIPRTLYEAATIDGATGPQQFFHITLPLLGPTTYFVTVMAVIGSLQVFDTVYILTNGGPAGATTTIVMYLFQNGFRYYKMGYASAMAYVLFILIFVLSLIQSRLSNKITDFSY